MGIVLDYAIFGIMFFVAVSAAYFIADAVIFLAYDLAAKGKILLLKRHWTEIIKSGLLAAALNNLTILVGATIVLNELFQKGLLIAGNFQAQPIGVPGAIAYLPIISIGKFVTIAVISLAFWWVVSLIISAYLIRKTQTAKYTRIAKPAKKIRRG